MIASNITEAELLDIIRFCAAGSAQCWDMAVDTDDSDRGYQDMSDACSAAYDAAIECLEGCYEGYLSDVRTHLEEARQLERDGGDDQHARRALAALDEMGEG